MKNWMAALGVRKMDEMERKMSDQSIRYAYLFLIVCLLIWSIAESAATIRSRGAHELSLVPCMLLVGASLIQSFSRLWLAKRSTAGDEEYRDDFSMRRVLALAALIAVMIVVLGSALTFWLVGMR